MGSLIFDKHFIERFFNLLKFPPKEKKLFISFLRKFKNRKDFYIVGGAVRAIFTLEKIYDVDLTLKDDVESLVFFVKEYLKYHFVPLAPELGIYRLAKGKCSIDFTAFRGETIGEDLKERDFTFNAMAIPVEFLFEDHLIIIDPFSGYEDLQKGLIKIIDGKNIIEDPLRILRGYRFFAFRLGNLEEKTRILFKKYKKRINFCAKERILQELIYILTSSKTYETFKLMDEDDVLEEIFPYIKDCKGVPQPSFHHLDVWGHLLESLKWAEEILKDPKKYLDLEIFPEKIDEDFIISVKLASFFHDLGKAHTFELRDRITFYGHEKISAELFKKMAENLKFKKDLINRIYILIKNHMRPFHLLNEKEKGRLTIRAKRNLIRDVPYLIELFIISMADSLASQGPDKEPDYEERLKNFFKELFKFKEELQKESTKEKLITGKDLIALGLKPGPIFRKILQEVELLVLEGKIKKKEEVLEFVKNKYINNNL
ncbi:HD domain-containing protein [Thermodesulfobacterium hydrogeniphilum]|uniref:HD domain-containing protein n=1 Tax=Thermodesulfobacterium hydrogeniphilum TaxID=161156 RepID=UPI00056E3F49|nr:HD domain-containing protein [Thermodesulfobacterium hydrogeniphilum]